MRASSTCIILFAFSLATCRRAPSEPKPESGAPSAQAQVNGRPEPKRFGEPIRQESVADLTRVLATPKEFKDKHLVVEGTVRRACSRKGCWMELAASGDLAAPGCRVTFKDYGFFVPTDSAGSSARVEANVEVAKLEASHVAHMEQEGAQFRNKQPDGSAEEVRLVATGVELWR
jgi:hypothetical protein